MSKLSSSRVNLFFVMDLTHFKKHAFNTRNYHVLRKKCLNTEFFLVHIWTLFTQWCIFQANVEYFTILRRSSTVIVFFTLPKAPSISISLFLIDFFVEYLFAFFNENLLRSECSFKEISFKFYSFVSWSDFYKLQLQGMIWTTQQFFKSS